MKFLAASWKLARLLVVCAAVVGCSSPSPQPSAKARVAAKFVPPTPNSTEDTAYPTLIDDANLLTEPERQELVAALKAHNQSGPGRLFLVTVKALPSGTSINQYAQLKINEYPSLPDEKSDRILLLIALQDRQMRIETSRDV